MAPWFERRRRLFLVTPVRLGRRDFFGEVVDEFAGRASDAGLDLVLKVPRGDYVGNDSEMMVNQTCPDMSRKDKLVVIPARTAANYRVLGKRMEGSRPFPAVALDLPANAGARALPHVKGDDVAGGQEAAKAALHFLSKVSAKDPSVLTIPGLWGIERATAFETAIKEVAAVKRLAACEWSSLAARGVLEAYLLTTKTPVDIVFCCNDDMALGARQAIRSARREGILAAKSTRVIGFDGTPGVRYLLESKDDVLLNSVHVDIGTQVRQTMELLHEISKDSHAAMPYATAADLKGVPPTGLLLSLDEQDALIHAKP